MDQCSRQQAIRVSSQQSQSIINIEMRSYNSGSTFTKNTSSATATATPFCKVCCDAGLPADKYNSHYVKDQPGPNGKVVCPTLLSQKCLICGVPGHTTRYCPDNPDNSSTSSTTSSSTVTDHRPRYASATDDIRSSLPPSAFNVLLLLPLLPFATLLASFMKRKQNSQHSPENSMLAPVSTMTSRFRNADLLMISKLELRPSTLLVLWNKNLQRSNTTRETTRLAPFKTTKLIRKMMNQNKHNPNRKNTTAAAHNKDVVVIVGISRCSN